MMLHWRDFSASHFFTWFGIRETGRVSAQGGATITCAPGAFTDDISLRFTVDGEEIVRGAELALNRAWMDGMRTAPFAADIVKSFILALAHDDPSMEALALHIERLTASLPGVIARPHAEEPLAPRLQRAIAPALAVYAGRAVRADLSGTAQSLVLEERGSSQAPRLLVVWTGTSGASRSRWRRWLSLWRPVAAAQ